MLLTGCVSLDGLCVGSYAPNPPRITARNGPPPPPPQPPFCFPSCGQGLPTSCSKHGGACCRWGGCSQVSNSSGGGRGCASANVGQALCGSAVGDAAPQPLHPLLQSPPPSNPGLQCCISEAAYKQCEFLLQCNSAVHMSCHVTLCYLSVSHPFYPLPSFLFMQALVLVLLCALKRCEQST